MNWFNRTFQSKKQEVRGKKREERAVSSHFSLLTSYSKFAPGKSRSPFRAGLLSVFLALFTGFLMIHTAEVLSAPKNLGEPSTTGQTIWTVEDATATKILPIDSATYSTYTLKTGGIDITNSDIRLKSDSYTALQTSDVTAQTTADTTYGDTCSSGSCSIGGGFGAGTSTSTNTAGTGAGAKVALTWVFACGDTIQDIDGNTYNTVLIGTQCWMKENLKVGTQVTGVTTMTNNGVIEKYCYSDTAANCTSDGGLYQWNEAMNYSAGCNGTGSSQPACSPLVQGICPSGWHIPSHYEWTLLERSLLGSTAFPYDTTTTGWLGTTEGTLLKSSGSPYFYALLAGYRNTSGSFNNRGTLTNFWSSSVNGSYAWYRSLDSGFATVRRYLDNQAYGFSVRCLKD